VRKGGEPYHPPMTRKRITVVLLALGVALTAIFMVGSFVSYAQPISSTRMQNIYLSRITTFGLPILALQFVSLILTLTDKHRPRPNQTGGDAAS